MEQTRIQPLPIHRKTVLPEEALLLALSLLPWGAAEEEYPQVLDRLMAARDTIIAIVQLKVHPEVVVLAVLNQTMTIILQTEAPRTLLLTAMVDLLSLV